ncbi:MAG: MerR family transcriptional regulator [Lentilactobacillus buchneri]|jgi:DNA-binding transcriptional MerR regulator|nr:MerR family transcriptional regulator [Lentilactobacillus buchneri]MCI2020575.1 MerR family transcriptional regulator [Lentilactobacillus buchneri]MCI2028552.1 MerR family transcriptional regulator [Lentilactobacillus buchneri]
MKTYSISQVSEMYHLPTTTLRYYEDLGLLYDIPRKGNRRAYTQQHLDRLGSICCFKNTGMTLSELQTLFSYSEHGGDLDKIVDLLNQHCQEVDEQLALLKQNQQHIKRKLHFYQDIRTAEQTNTPLPDWDNYRSKTFH